MMYKKVTFILFFLFLTVLLLMANRFSALQYFIVEASQKSLLLNKAADDFTTIGFTICIVNWVWVNVLAIKIKQLSWLIIPFIFTVFVSLVMSWQAETIFIFNKQNGMWKGGFSLSYFLGIVIIFFGITGLLMNYSILKSHQNNKKTIKK